MRKLIWYNFVGFVMLASGYGVLRYAAMNPDSAVGKQVLNFCGLGASHHPVEKPTYSADVTPASCARLCAYSRDTMPSVTGPRESEQPLQTASSDVIDLPAASVNSPASIVIQESEEPPVMPPAEDTEMSEEYREVAVLPPLMPHCDDDLEVPARMPYADEEVRTTKTSLVTWILSWFEESRPAESWPACREDENLPRHYPGCPFPGDTYSPDKNTPKKGTMWQHEKEPILPIRSQPE
jgi:hypothetical protein